MKTIFTSFFIIIALNIKAVPKSYIIMNESDCSSCMIKVKSLNQSLGYNVILLVGSKEQRESDFIAKITKNLSIQNVVNDSILYTNNNIGSSIFLS